MSDSIGGVGGVGFGTPLGVVGMGASTASAAVGAAEPLYDMSGMQQVGTDGLNIKDDLTDAVLLALLLDTSNRQDPNAASDVAIALLAVTAIKAYDSMQAMSSSLGVAPVSMGFQATA